MHTFQGFFLFLFSLKKDKQPNKLFNNDKKKKQFDTNNGQFKREGYDFNFIL